MEYLLQRDGSVQPIKDFLSHDCVLELLLLEGSVCYYWHTPEFLWSSFRLIDGDPDIAHNTAVVPDVIKLAVMLE